MRYTNFLSIITTLVFFLVSLAFSSDLDVNQYSKKLIIERPDLNFGKVWSGGSWSYGGAEGYYRVLIIDDGYKPIVNRILVEWISNRSDNPNDHIAMALAPVDESMYPSKFVFSYPHCLVYPSCSKLRFDVLDVVKGNKLSMELDFISLGEVSVRIH